MQAILAGSVVKLYDDLHDTGTLQDPFLLECLKGLTWMSLALLGHRDFNFILLFYVINALNAAFAWEEWNFPYEQSLLAIVPFLIASQWGSRERPSVADVVYLLAFVAIMILEPLLIREEIGWKKLVSRIGGLMASVGGIVLGSMWGVSPSVLKVNWFGIGYSATSIGFQAWKLGGSGAPSHEADRAPPPLPSPSAPDFEAPEVPTATTEDPPEPPSLPPIAPSSEALELPPTESVPAIPGEPRSTPDEPEREREREPEPEPEPEREPEPEPEPVWVPWEEPRVPEPTNEFAT